MNTVKLRVQSLASDIISIVLAEHSAANLAKHEHEAALSVATALVEWNRGKLPKVHLNAVAAASHDILEAVRRRREEIHDGKTSLA